MTSIFNSANKDKLQQLQIENDELKIRIAKLEKVITDLNVEIADSAVAIDFEAMKAFSIERTVNNNRPCTIVGYFINDPVIGNNNNETCVAERQVVKEWTLYCNTSYHDKLVEQFKLWKASK